MTSSSLIALTLLASAATLCLAEEPLSEPRQVPLTRPVMKHLLEDMKARTPRIPLPELTEEEKARQAERTDGRGGSGGYESRLRSVYMNSGERRTSDRPAGDRPASGGNNAFGFGGREPDPKATLDNKFKVQLFWIVSRTNNCQYCLGHQEHKLLAAGMKEDEIAALDTNWLEFPIADQAAFAYARKFTFEPHKLSDADIDGLRKHFTDMQILEMTLSMAGNNAINRWKEGAGVPQSKSNGFGRRNTDPNAPPAPDTYETPTSEKYAGVQSIVAPIFFDEAGKATTKTVSRRPALESREEVERALTAAHNRKPRLPLVDEATARAILPEDWPQGRLPQWVLLMANFPRDGRSRIVSQRSSETTGDLTPLMKAQASWIIARGDRAWYATGLAKKRLKDAGQTDDQIYALDGDWKSFSAKDRAMFTLARKLAATPVVLTDADVAVAVKEAGPRDVVQLISYTTVQASFDRITEAAGLGIE